MTAYIMVDSKGMPFTRNMYDLYQGFKELGEDIKTYTAADLFQDTIPADKDNIVVGHIDQCRSFVKKITGKYPENVDYPKELIPYMKRKFQLVKLGDIYLQIAQMEQVQPIFIKSFEQKHITGFVCNSFKDFVTNCTGRDMDKLVYISDVVDFKAEFRTYIHRHDIVTSLRYKGDYSLAPSKSVLEEMLYSLRDAHMPIAYSIDVGINEKGETILIECNDGFALGNYGVPARKYAEMHMDRWYQMVS